MASCSLILWPRKPRGYTEVGMFFSSCTTPAQVRIELMIFLNSSTSNIFVWFNTATVLSSPIPVSTFCCLSGSHVPFLFLLYCINTSFHISTYLPQSQFVGQGSAPVLPVVCFDLSGRLSVS